MTEKATVHPLAVFARIEALLVRALTVLLTVLFGIIFVLVTLLVIMRYGFNSTIVGGAEATVYLFIYTTALGTSVDIARGKHIRIDSLIGLLPETPRRYIEMLNLVLIGILNAFLFVYAIEWIRVVGNSKDPILHVPEAVVEIAVPIGCLFAVFFCFTRLIALASTAPQEQG